MKLYEYLGKRLLKADVGIEIEVEGEGLVHENLDSWDYKEDGSLRGESAEYVFHLPKPIADVPACMDELNLALANASLDMSYRTSVHVHVNCLHLEHKEVLAFLYGALLLEEPLMTYCGRERKGNRFCLRVNDAEGLLSSLDYIFGGDGFEYLRGIEQDTNRYAAVNIDALCKFGSLEFRGMRGTTDKTTIVTWANALVNLRNFCNFLGSPDAVMEHYLKNGPADFLTAALGDVAASFRYPKFISEIQRSFSLSIDLPNTYKRASAKKEVAPKIAKKQAQWKDPWMNLAHQEAARVRAGDFINIVPAPAPLIEDVFMEDFPEEDVYPDEEPL